MFKGNKNDKEKINGRYTKEPNGTSRGKKYNM